jgi:membrane protease YdiL (CAAX protease family)
MGFIQRHSRAFVWLAAYAAVWGAAVLALILKGADPMEDAVPVMVVFGLGLTGLGALLTLGERAPAAPVRRPGLELAAAIAYLALYAVAFTGWGLSAFHEAVPPGRTAEILMMALKLTVHVLLPAALLLALGASLRPLLTARLGTRGFWLCLVILGAAILAVLCFISPALKQIAALHAAPTLLAVAIGGSFIWVAIEAGLCEEFLFRAVLQTRLAAVLKSEAGAVLVAAVLFALAHVPGLYLRGGGEEGHSASLVQVIAYAVAVLSPAGLFLGFIWARTRSLLLIVLLHGLVDVLPNTADFARTWLGA